MESVAAEPVVVDGQLYMSCTCVCVGIYVRTVEIMLSIVSSWFLAEAISAISMGDKVFDQGHAAKDFYLSLVNKLLL